MSDEFDGDGDLLAAFKQMSGAHQMRRTQVSEDILNRAIDALNEDLIGERGLSSNPEAVAARKRNKNPAVRKALNAARRKKANTPEGKAAAKKARLRRKKRMHQGESQSGLRLRAEPDGSEVTLSVVGSNGGQLYGATASKASIDRVFKAMQDDLKRSQDPEEKAAISAIVGKGLSDLKRIIGDVLMGDERIEIELGESMNGPGANLSESKDLLAFFKKAKRQLSEDIERDPVDAGLKRACEIAESTQDPGMLMAINLMMAVKPNRAQIEESWLPLMAARAEEQVAEMEDDPEPATDADEVSLDDLADIANRIGQTASEEFEPRSAGDLEGFVAESDEEDDAVSAVLAAVADGLPEGTDMPDDVAEKCVDMVHAELAKPGN